MLILHCIIRFVQSVFKCFAFRCLPNYHPPVGVLDSGLPAMQLEGEKEERREEGQPGTEIY